MFSWYLSADYLQCLYFFLQYHPLPVEPLTNGTMFSSNGNFHSIYDFVDLSLFTTSYRTSIKTSCIILIHKSGRSNDSSLLVSGYGWGNVYNLYDNGTWGIAHTVKLAFLFVWRLCSIDLFFITWMSERNVVFREVSKELYREEPSRLPFSRIYEEVFFTVSGGYINLMML